MINDNSITYVNGQGVGYALAWIIDDECLYTLALNRRYANIFLLSNKIEDVSESYPNEEGITVRFYKDDNFVEDFNTSEYFGSILLSPHKVINLFGHDYGWYAKPINTKFINNKFVILDERIEDLDINAGMVNGLSRIECSELTCHCYMWSQNV